MKPKDSLNIKTLRQLFRGLRSRYSFGTIKTLHKALEFLGMTEYELSFYEDKPLTISLLNALESNYILSYEQEEKWNQNCCNIYEQKEHDYEGVEYRYNADGSRSGSSSNSVREESHKETYETDKERKEPEVIISPKIAPHIKLLPHQNPAAFKILKAITVHKKRALQLRAGTGVGKTYILAAVIRKLLDDKFPEQYNCLAPWPFVWITRASVVEKTSRECRDYFGIDLYTELLVVGIDQMRSRFGEIFLKEETIIQQGEEHIKWIWRFPHHPLVFIIDESHLAKNEDSAQSKIIQSLSEITKPIFIIFSSATPFARVTEAKYFAVNTHAELIH